MSSNPSNTHLGIGRHSDTLQLDLPFGCCPPRPSTGLSPKAEKLYDAMLTRIRSNGFSLVPDLRQVVLSHVENLQIERSDVSAAYRRVLMITAATAFQDNKEGATALAALKALRNFPKDRSASITIKKLTDCFQKFPSINDDVWCAAIADALDLCPRGGKFDLRRPNSFSGEKWDEIAKEVFDIVSSQLMSARRLERQPLDRSKSIVLEEAARSDEVRDFSEVRELSHRTLVFAARAYELMRANTTGAAVEWKEFHQEYMAEAKTRTAHFLEKKRSKPSL